MITREGTTRLFIAVKSQMRSRAFMLTLAAINMASWNLKELREKAAIFLNGIEKNELIAFLDSFNWKSKATAYHLLQADESFRPYREMDGKQWEGLLLA